MEEFQRTFYKIQGYFYDEQKSVVKQIQSYVHPLTLVALKLSGGQRVRIRTDESNDFEINIQA